VVGFATEVFFAAVLAFAAVEVVFFGVAFFATLLFTVAAGFLVVLAAGALAVFLVVVTLAGVLAADTLTDDFVAEVLAFTGTLVAAVLVFAAGLF
jgi:hypothetical protein